MTLPHFWQTAAYYHRVQAAPSYKPALLDTRLLCGEELWDEIEHHKNQRNNTTSQHQHGKVQLGL